MIDILSDIAKVLNNCPSVDVSNFKRPLDSRVSSIKDIQKCDIFSGNNYVAIIADEQGKLTGKAIPFSCAPTQVEQSLECFVYPEIENLDTL